MTPTHCRHCGSRGRATGRVRLGKRAWFVRLTCDTPSCVFTFTRATMGDHLDGTTAHGRPTWLVHESEAYR